MMKKNYEAPVLFCDEFVQDTMIASSGAEDCSNPGLDSGDYCYDSMACLTCDENGEWVENDAGTKICTILGC